MIQYGRQDGSGVFGVFIVRDHEVLRPHSYLDLIAGSAMTRGSLPSGVSDNKNVESRTRYVVNYVINNIISTALTGRRKTATYLHLMRELLYKIDWPSGIRLTYWHFVRALPIFCD